MHRVLIADGSDIFADAVCAALEKHFEVTSCTDASQVLDLVRIFQPDIILLDLQMPGEDGLAIFENIRNIGSNAEVIVIARLLSDYVERTLIRLRTTYVLTSPCKICNAVYRLKDVAKQMLSENVRTPNLLERAERTLLALGFRPSLIGFRCTVEAIAMMAENPDMAVTKQVYPAVAQICGSSEIQVEHAIRLTIADAWKYHDDALWAGYFSKNKDGMVRRPTNAVLLTQLAACIRNRI